MIKEKREKRFQLPENFQPKFKEIKDEADVSYNNVIRKKYNLFFNKELSKTDMENQIKASLNTFLLSKKNQINSVAVFCYHIDQPNLLIARGFFAPDNGNWSKAHEFKSYQENNLNIAFYEELLNEKLKK